MQGIPTPGQRLDPEGERNGWQHAPGDQNDRDLKFFDAVLETLRAEYSIDERRIYAAGHSNGASFTYLLWAERSDVFAALAPSAGGGEVVRSITDPKPVMMIAGENDQIVRLRGQRRILEGLLTLNGCDRVGESWDQDCTLYTSATGTPIVTFVHGGDHAFPEEAPPLIVRFFQEHLLPEE
jgi:polyhydroxybutyrate depolymerase